MVLRQHAVDRFRKVLAWLYAGVTRESTGVSGMDLVLVPAAGAGERLAQLAQPFRPRRSARATSSP
jgi:hypothetical protein